MRFLPYFLLFLLLILALLASFDPQVKSFNAHHTNKPWPIHRRVRRSIAGPAGSDSAAKAEFANLSDEQIDNTLKATEQNKTTLETELNDADLKLNKTKNQLEEATADYGEKKEEWEKWKELNGWKKKATRAKSIINNKNWEISQQNISIANIQKELEPFEKNVQVAQQKLDDLNDIDNTIIREQDEATRLQNELKSYEDGPFATLKTYKTENESAVEALDVLIEKKILILTSDGCADSTGSIISAKAAIDPCKTSIEEFDKINQTLPETIRARDNARTLYSTAETNLGRLQTAKSDQDYRVGKFKGLKNNPNELANAIAEAQKKLNEAISEKDEKAKTKGLQEKIALRNKAQEELADAISVRDEANTKLSGYPSDAQVKEAKASEVMEAAETKMNTLTGELSTQRKAIEEKQQQLKEVENRIAAMKKEKAKRTRPEPSTSGGDVFTIIGSVVGGVLLVVVIAVVIAFFRKKLIKSKKEKSETKTIEYLRSKKDTHSSAELNIETINKGRKIEHPVEDEMNETGFLTFDEFMQSKSSKLSNLMKAEVEKYVKYHAWDTKLTIVSNGVVRATDIGSMTFTEQEFGGKKDIGRRRQLDPYKYILWISEEEMSGEMLDKLEDKLKDYLKTNPPKPGSGIIQIDRFANIAIIAPSSAPKDVPREQAGKEDGSRIYETYVPERTWARRLFEYFFGDRWEYETYKIERAYMKEKGFPDDDEISDGETDTEEETEAEEDQEPAISANQEDASGERADAGGNKEEPSGQPDDTQPTVTQGGTKDPSAGKDQESSQKAPTSGDKKEEVTEGTQNVTESTKQTTGKDNTTEGPKIPDMPETSKKEEAKKEAAARKTGSGGGTGGILERVESEISRELRLQKEREREEQRIAHEDWLEFKKRAKRRRKNRKRMRKQQKNVSERPTIFSSVKNVLSIFSSFGIPDVIDMIPFLARMYPKHEKNKILADQYPALCSMIDMVTEEFRKGPRCLELDLTKYQTTVVTDIHGQLETLLKIINHRSYKDRPSYTCRQFLFLGDYVDRGKHSLQTIMLLIALRLAYPEFVYMVRGNHEDYNICKKYGFVAEINEIFKDNKVHANILIDKFKKMFAAMPISAVISKKIFCCHGNIPVSLKGQSLAEIIKRINKVSNNLMDPKSDAVALELMWDDPTLLLRGTTFNGQRGDAHGDGIDVIRETCEPAEIDMVIRGHQVAKGGFESVDGDNYYTMFSAPNYGREYNHGAVLDLKQIAGSDKIWMNFVITCIADEGTFEENKKRCQDQQQTYSNHTYTSTKEDMELAALHNKILAEVHGKTDKNKGGCRAEVAQAPDNGDEDPTQFPQDDTVVPM